MNVWLFPALAFAAIVTLLRPMVGIVIFMVGYPMVPSSEGISPLEFGMFLATVFLIGRWLLRERERNEWLSLYPEYRWVLWLFLYLCFSPFLGVLNGFSIVDWGRDIVPLLNILLIPVFADFLGKNERMFRYFLIVPACLSAVQAILSLLSMDGGVSIDPRFFSFRLIPFQPSLGFGIGLFLYLHKIKPRALWFSFCVLNLLVSLFTFGRTIWIGTAIVTIIAIFSANTVRLPRAFMAILFLISLAFFTMSWLAPSTLINFQEHRMQQLENFREDLSFESRIDEIKQCGKLFLSHPIFGVGFGYIYVFWRHFVKGIGAGYLESNFTHCDIMFMASKGGLIGLTLFILVMYSFGRRLYQIRRDNIGNEISGWASIGLLMVVMSVVLGLSTPIFQYRVGTFIFAIVLGMAFGRNREYLRERGVLKNSRLVRNFCPFSCSPSTIKLTTSKTRR